MSHIGHLDDMTANFFIDTFDLFIAKKFKYESEL